jgi:hypothetical protein
MQQGRRRRLSDNDGVDDRAMSDRRADTRDIRGGWRGPCQHEQRADNRYSCCSSPSTHCCRGHDALQRKCYRWERLGDLLDEVERHFGDLTPAVVDRERVTAVGELPEVGDRG